MSRALLFLLLGGCWPLIEGPYSDHTDDTGSDTDVEESDLPAGSAVIGFMEWTEFRGNYWSDVGDGDFEDGLVTWGISLEGAPNALTPFEGSPCKRLGNWSWADWWVGFEGDDGSVLAGAEDYTLDWQEGTPVYARTLAAGQGFAEGLTWDLEPTQTEWGTLEVADFVRTPTPATLTTPRLGGTDSQGTQPDILGKGDLTFEWTGSAGEVVVLRLLSVDASTNLLDEVGCVIRSRNSVTVPGDLFDDLETAQGAYVLFGTAIESSGSIGGGQNRMVGLHWQQGFVYLE